MAINSDVLLPAATTRTISSGQCRYTAQTIVFPATAITTTDYTRFDTGFKARKVKITNLTDRISIEWNSSLPADRWIKTVAAGTVTDDTTASALVINDRSVDVLQAAALVILASKTVLFEAWD